MKGIMSIDNQKKKSNKALGLRTNTVFQCSHAA